VLEDALGVTCRLTGGTASSDILVRSAKEIPTVRVTMRESRVRRLLGVDIPLAEAKTTLERLGFACTMRDGSIEARSRADAPKGLSLDTVVPSHRPDVTREVDVIDEAVRVRGMDTVPATLPAIHATRPAGSPPMFHADGGREALLRNVRRAATSLGLSEALTFGFTSRKALAALSAPAPLVIDNPLTEDLDAMRTSLLPGLLEAVRRARRRGVGDVRLFTTGSLFLGEEERASFAAVLAGDRPAYLERPSAYDVWDASGLATALVPRLVHALAEIVPTSEGSPHLHPRGRAEVRVSGKKVGTLGPIHPDVDDALDLGGPVMVVEIDLEAVVAVDGSAAGGTSQTLGVDGSAAGGTSQTLGVGHPAYVPIPRHPSATRDIALVVRDGVPAGDVLRALREAAGPLATDVTLFDRFVGGSVPAGHASLAFHVIYQAPSDNPHTLTDAEVDASHQKVVAEMERRFGASLRA
jgi:phenylalanyl-tRNA synthetase beta chain